MLSQIEIIFFFPRIENCLQQKACCRILVYLIAVAKVKCCLVDTIYTNNVNTCFVYSD